MTLNHATDRATLFTDLVQSRRSVRAFLPTPIAPAVLAQVLADASQAPSWSNTQPYRVAIANGTIRDHLAAELSDNFDIAAVAAKQGLSGRLKLLLTRKGLPDGDYSTQIDYPVDLLQRRRSTGHGLYASLGIPRDDHAAREAQMRRNFQFFDAPVALFLFVHKSLEEFAVLDAGIWLQTLMLSAHAHGLGTCTQGALATWAGPVKTAFEVPAPYKLICGVALGYASDHAVNRFNPGREAHESLQLQAR